MRIKTTLSLNLAIILSILAYLTTNNIFISGMVGFLSNIYLSFAFINSTFLQRINDDFYNNRKSWLRFVLFIIFVVGAFIVFIESFDYDIRRMVFYNAIYLLWVGVNYVILDYHNIDQYGEKA